MRGNEILNNENFHQLYEQYKMDEMSRTCGKQGGKKQKIMVGKCKKSPLKRTRHRWRDVINMGLHEYGGKMWTVSSWVKTDKTLNSCEGGK
jgi:hypothetical protein